MVIGVSLAVLASLLFNAGIVVQAQEAREVSSEHGLRLSLLGRLVRRPRWLLGTALGALAVPLQVVALLFAPVTAVQPAETAGLVLLLFLGSRLLGERVGRREVMAVVGIGVGIAAIVAAGPARSVTHAGALDLAIGLSLVGAAAAAPFVLRRRAGTGGLVVVLGAGFAFAWSAFAIKLIADALSAGSWGAVALLVPATLLAGLVGTLSEQTAFQRRPATQVAPLIFVVELLVPIALAMALAGERWTGGLLTALGVAASLALVIWSVAVLARAPAVAGLLEPDAAPAPSPA
jgi:drug/metabolite transporter (DMT)-like permease